VEKETYRIQYYDNTYQLVEWTRDEYDLVGEAMMDDAHVIVLNKGIFRLDHIRAIVHLDKMEEENNNTPVNDDEGMVITEMGAFEKEVYDLLVASGIELGDVLGERRKK
jgi:hypothetical protein